MNDAQPSVVIQRRFDAPIELVWKMWTDPALFASWYGPSGANVPVAKMNVEVGGKRLICMEMATPKGTMQMWFCGEYLEISAPQRLVYTESMSDELGNPKPASELPPGHPESTQVVVELSAVDGQTQMTMTHLGVPAGTPGEAGWNMAFDKLVAQLAGHAE